MGRREEEEAYASPSALRFPPPPLSSWSHCLHLHPSSSSSPYPSSCHPAPRHQAGAGAARLSPSSRSLRMEDDAAERATGEPSVLERSEPTLLPQHSLGEPDTETNKRTPTAVQPTFHLLYRSASDEDDAGAMRQAVPPRASYRGPPAVEHDTETSEMEEGYDSTGGRVGVPTSKWSRERTKPKGVRSGWKNAFRRTEKAAASTASDREGAGYTSASSVATSSTRPNPTPRSASPMTDAPTPTAATFDQTHQNEFQTHLTPNSMDPGRPSQVAPPPQGHTLPEQHGRSTTALQERRPSRHSGHEVSQSTKASRISGSDGPATQAPRSTPLSTDSSSPSAAGTGGTFSTSIETTDPGPSSLAVPAPRVPAPSDTPLAPSPVKKRRPSSSHKAATIASSSSSKQGPLASPTTTMSSNRASTSGANVQASSPHHYHQQQQQQSQHAQAKYTPTTSSTSTSTSPRLHKVVNPPLEPQEGHGSLSKREARRVAEETAGKSADAIREAVSAPTYLPAWALLSFLRVGFGKHELTS